MAKSKRKVPGINGSSTADIAFILLIFFLITTSMDTDKGLKRRLPPLMPKEEKQEDIEINERNIMQLLVNRNDQIAISREGRVEYVSLENLKDRVKLFIVNPNDDPRLPEKEMRFIEGLGERSVTTSSYAISIKNEVETSYQMYISVQNEMIKAYNEVWDEVAQREFRQKFESLSPERQKSVVDMYPMHITETPLAELS